MAPPRPRAHSVGADGSIEAVVSGAARGLRERSPSGALDDSHPGPRLCPPRCGLSDCAFPSLASVTCVQRSMRERWRARGRCAAHSHLVAPEDLRWILALTSARTVSGAAARHRQLRITERDVAMCREARYGPCGGTRSNPCRSCSPPLRQLASRRRPSAAFHLLVDALPERNARARAARRNPAAIRAIRRAASALRAISEETRPSPNCCCDTCGATAPRRSGTSRGGRASR